MGNRWGFVCFGCGDGVPRLTLRRVADGTPLALLGFVIVLSFLLSLLALFRVRFLLLEDEAIEGDDEEEDNDVEEVATLFADTVALVPSEIVEDLLVLLFVSLSVDLLCKLLPFLLLLALEGEVLQSFVFGF